MQSVFMDEAGTSAPEPVSVVAGIIVLNAEQLASAEARLADVIDNLLPAHFQAGFFFHAKDIWGHDRFKSGWTLKERIAFLHAIMAIPAQENMGNCSPPVVGASA